MNKYMRRGPLFFLLGLLVLTACRDKELDMTVRNKTLFEGAEWTVIEAQDAWNVVVVQDDGPSYVELEYSAFLEEYLLVTKQSNTLAIELTQRVYCPSNTVKTAVVHMPSVERFLFIDAVTASLQGNFSGATLRLDGAATCKGGHFSGETSLKLGGASKMVDLDFNGTSCLLEVDDASTFKGTLTASTMLTVKADNASWVTTYGGYAPLASVDVKAASSVNMLSTEVEEMTITMTSAATASVNVTETLHGTLRDASSLYYYDGPDLDIDKDTTSILSPLTINL